MPRFERIRFRRLPDGGYARMYPFHFSLEGTKSRILCREDADYDAFVKIMAVCAFRLKVAIVIYIVVSNHVHAVILCENQMVADLYGNEVKRMYSMYFSRRHRESSAMKGLDSKSIYIDSDWYLRNAICYDIRNAMDNGAHSVSRYNWSGYRAMFCEGLASISGDPSIRAVSGLSRRECRRIFHTDENLSGVKWVINGNEELEPVSFCDWEYLESAFGGDQAFFMKTVGLVNVAEMNQKLVSNPRVFLRDGDFLASVNEISQRWFKQDVRSLSITQKARLFTYIHHSFRTNPKQLARTFELPPEKIDEWLNPYGQ